MKECLSGPERILVWLDTQRAPRMIFYWEVVEQALNCTQNRKVHIEHEKQFRILFFSQPALFLSWQARRMQCACIRARFFKIDLSLPQSNH